MSINKAIIAQKYFLELEAKIQETILECTEYDWYEDYITRSLLKLLRKELNEAEFELLNTKGEKAKIWLNIFKATGNLETKCGDITFIVRLVHKDNDTIEGVSFIEAKKRYSGKGFKALNFSQLEKFLRKSPRSLLLLYDYEKNYKNRVWGFTNSSNWQIQYTHTLITQSHLAVHLNKKDESLYKICYPLSHQILERYTRGLDLEFKNETVREAKGYLENKNITEYAVIMNVVYNNKGEPHIDINNESFEEFE